MLVTIDCYGSLLAGDFWLVFSC